MQSSTSDRPFHFNWDSLKGEETRHRWVEGLTIWDLDNHDPVAPGIQGQLHVLIKDNFKHDNVTFRHYTSKIYVDADHIGDQWGIPGKPFITVGEANTFPYPWNGSKILIDGYHTNNYPETITIDKFIQVRAEPGPVIIGE